MQRRPLNISAALAIAIERQVEDIIANAKTQCALRNRSTPRHGPPDSSISSSRFALRTDFDDPEGERRRQCGDKQRPWSDFAGSEVPFAQPTPAPRTDLWARLQSLLRARPFRS